MNDDLRFRAWDEKGKRWLHGYEPGKVGCSIFGEVMVCGGWLDEVGLEGLNDVTVEQYIGLKDENGVEIYAEDIVLWREDFPGDVIKIVMFGGPWDYAAFGLTGPRDTPRFDDDTTETWDLLSANIAAHCKIIGNTHDTPELAP